MLRIWDCLYARRARPPRKKYVTPVRNPGAPISVSLDVDIGRNQAENGADLRLPQRLRSSQKKTTHRTLLYLYDRISR